MAGKNNGTAFERQLETIFAAYLKQGRAKIEKVDAPTKVVQYRPPGSKVMKSRVIFMQNPWLDFAGVWTERDGRALLIEAKTTQKPILELGGDHGLTKAQWGNAMDWQRAGAMVMLLWEHKGEIRVTTPSMAMADCRENERKSLRWCDAHKLPQGLGWVTFDPLTWAARLTD